MRTKLEIMYSVVSTRASFSGAKFIRKLSQDAAVVNVAVQLLQKLVQSTFDIRILSVSSYLILISNVILI